jgi:hypothetical protein
MFADDEVLRDLIPCIVSRRAQGFTPVLAVCFDEEGDMTLETTLDADELADLLRELPTIDTASLPAPGATSGWRPRESAVRPILAGSHRAPGSWMRRSPAQFSRRPGKKVDC